MPVLHPALACFLIVMIILAVMAGAWAIRNWRDDPTDEEFWP
jgi:hypothetical protein